jgi:uncharacterized membrane protein YeaQ/YmgE (transglycosylase-associated protein family)
LALLVGLGLGSRMVVFLTLVAIFWAIFTHMAAELVGVPSRFRSALLSTLVGWVAAQLTAVLADNALVPTIIAGAIGSYVGMRIFYKAPPLRSLALFIMSTLVTIAVFGGIVAYMAMQRSRV